MIAKARQPRERIGLGVDGAADVVDGFAHRLLEQGQDELVLAVEVLVETAQRLLRALDDLLDREIGRAVLVDELEGRVEDALHPFLGARAGRVEAASDRVLAPPGRGRLRHSTPPFLPRRVAAT